MTDAPQTFSPSSINILVAEDDAQMRSIVVDALRKDGYVIDPVSDGGEVMLRIIDSYRVTRTLPRIDLVVTDVRMPVSNGLNLVESMRHAGWTIPVVIMTAFGDAATCERAQALGATLLDKPFKMRELRQRVRDLLMWAHAPAPPAQ